MTSKLNILSITTLFPNKHKPRHGIFIANRLAKLNQIEDVNIHIIAPKPLNSFAAIGAEDSTELDSNFLSVHRPRFISIPILNQYASAIVIAISMLYDVYKLKTKHKIDVIDSHYAYPDAVAACIISKILRKPLVITSRGSDINYWPSKWFPRKLIKWAISSASVSAAVSQDLSNKLTLLVPYKPHHVLENGVDFSVFFPPKKYNNENIVISVGNLVALKNHDIVIKAIGKTVDTKLKIIGKGPEENKLKDLVKKLKLNDRVSFFPNLTQHNLAKEYRRAHCLVLASSSEGMPNVVLEALACGTYVITNDIGDLERLIPKNTGKTIKHINPESLADEITNIMMKDYNKDKVGKLAKQKFCWKHTITRYYDLLKSAGSN